MGNWSLKTFFCLGCLSFLAWGLPATAMENDLQQWDQINLKVPLSADKKVLGQLEIQPRLGSVEGVRDFWHPNQLIIRPSIGYQLTPKVSVWQGYGWTPFFEPDFKNEHRIYQQLQIDNRLKKLSLTNRTRLEERFIEGAGGTSLRGRHMLRGAYPLGNSGKWSLVASNEIFVNLNSPSHAPKSGLDQNRAFAGINRRINKHINMEAGYLNAYVNRAEPIANRMNHVIMFTVNLLVD